MILCLCYMMHFTSYSGWTYMYAFWRSDCCMHVKGDGYGDMDMHELVLGRLPLHR